MGAPQHGSPDAGLSIRERAITELAHITVSAGYLNSDQREAHRNPANVLDNRPDRTVLLKLQRESGSRASNRDQFVSIGIAKISEICPIWAHTRRVLD